jgi:hypothetical protein
LYGKDTTATTLTVSYLPVDGETIYVRLWTNFGNVWKYNDYTFAAASSATLTSPAQGATFTGRSQIFAWSPVAGATNYALCLGTGVGSCNLFGKATTDATLTANYLPVDGETIYARLSTNFSGVSTHTDYTFIAASAATLISPTSGATLAGSNPTFTWTPLAGATSYTLLLGSTGVGSANLYSKNTTATSLTAAFLPVDGETIYARLLTNFNGIWTHIDYTFTAASPATLTSPAPGATFTGRSQTFTWAPVAGATNYALCLGNTGVGSCNLFGKATTDTTLTDAYLPVDGETIYARLVTNFNGVNTHNDYTFTAK